MGEVYTVHHPERLSQYTYGGNTACTYCSLEASLFFLHGFIDKRMPPEELHKALENILINGVGMDLLKDGHKAPDEVILKSERFARLLTILKISGYDLRDSSCFQNLLFNIKDCTKNIGPKIAVCLTRPPETIALFYDAQSETYCLFDSHLYNQKGAYFAFMNFKNCVRMLSKRFEPKLGSVNMDHGLEATFLLLGEEKLFLDISAFEEYRKNANWGPLQNSLNYSMHIASGHQTQPHHNIPYQPSLHSTTMMNSTQSNHPLNYPPHHQDTSNQQRHIGSYDSQNSDYSKNSMQSSMYLEEDSNTSNNEESNKLKNELKAYQEENQKLKVSIQELERKFVKSFDLTTMDKRELCMLILQKDSIIQEQANQLKQAEQLKNDFLLLIQRNHEYLQSQSPQIQGNPSEQVE